MLGIVKLIAQSENEFVSTELNLYLFTRKRLKDGRKRNINPCNYTYFMKCLIHII